MSKRPLSPVGKSNPYFYCQKDYLETDITSLPKLSHDEETWKKILEESEREETKDIPPGIQNLLNVQSKRHSDFLKHLQKGQEFEKLRDKKKTHKTVKLH